MTKRAVVRNSGANNEQEGITLAPLQNVITNQGKTREEQIERQNLYLKKNKPFQSLWKMTDILGMGSP